MYNTVMEKMNFGGIFVSASTMSQNHPHLVVSFVHYQLPSHLEAVSLQVGSCRLRDSDSRVLDGRRHVLAEILHHVRPHGVFVRRLVSVLRRE